MNNQGGRGYIDWDELRWEVYIEEKEVMCFISGSDEVHGSPSNCSEKANARGYP